MNGLAVKAYLVTYDFNYRQTVADLERLARSLCVNFATLQSEGHPKWREVQLATPPLGQGWSYYRPMERVLGSCAPSRPGTPRPAMADGPNSASCSQQERILGLCQRP